MLQGKNAEKAFFRTDRGVLYQGDCLELIKAVPDSSIDLIFSDYPFNSQDGRKDYVQFIKDLSDEFYRVLKPDCVLVVVNNPRNIWKTKDAYTKFTHRDSVALIRKGSLRAAWHFGFQHNYLMSFVKGDNIRAKWNGTKKNHDKSFLTDVIEYQNGFRAKGYFHPQAMPLWLVEKMIEIFSFEGDLVLDPFLGAGTIAVACENLNRRWIGFELEDKHCNQIKRRLTQSKTLI